MYDRIIYVAGPYRANSEWELELNIRAAENAAIALWKKGWAVICPHKNTAHFGGILPHEAWLAGDLTMLRRLNPHRDAIFLVPGWQRSEGSKGEREIAFLCGLTIYERMDDVPDLTRD